MSKKVNPLHQVQFLAGQMAALETLVLALHATHPDKDAVERVFADDSERTRILAATEAPPPFRDGYSERAKTISTFLRRGSKPSAPQQTH